MVFLIRIWDIKLGVQGRALLVADTTCQVQRIGWLFRDLGWEIERLATINRKREPWDGANRLGIPYLTLTKEGWRLVSGKRIDYWTHHEFLKTERIAAAKNQGK